MPGWVSFEVDFHMHVLIPFIDQVGFSQASATAAANTIATASANATGNLSKRNGDNISAFVGAHLGVGRILAVAESI